MKRSEWTYLAHLARAMQSEGIEGSVAGDFLAEIDGHLAAHDVDPVDEFGRPADLARSVAARDGHRAPWRRRSIHAALVVGGTALLLVVIALEAHFAGWPAVVEVPAGTVLQGLATIVMIAILEHVGPRQLDGRRWSSMYGWRSWLVVAIGAFVGATLAREFSDIVMFWIDRVTVIVGLVVGVVLLVGMVAAYRNPLRLPRHAHHLYPLRVPVLAAMTDPAGIKRPGDADQAP